MLKAKKHRLVVAVALLILSAVLMSTASYAWFAMNTRTSADDFKVEAYTDSRFLQISTTNVDANYTTAISYASADPSDLRLTTTDVLGVGDTVYTGTFTVVPAGTYYTGGETAYYKKALSDVGAAVGAYNYTLVAFTTDDLPTDLRGLYTDITFVPQLGTADDTTKAYTYFTKDGNDFVKYTGTIATGDSLKGKYLLQQGNVLVTNGLPASPGTYVSGTYYEKDGTGAFAVKTGLTSASTLVGLYAGITWESVNGRTADESQTYYQLNEGKYTVATPEASAVLDDTYFLMKQDDTVVAEPVAIAAADYNYTTSNTKQYWEKDASGNFSVAENLTVGTDVSGLYTASVTATPVTEDSAFDGSVYYMVSAQNDYVCLGRPADETLMNGYRYWGRSYSNTLTNAESTNTLNILPANDSENTEYYLKNTFYLRQGEATTHAQNLRIAKVTVEGAKNNLDLALRVLFVATSTSGEQTIFTYDAANAADIPADEGKLFDVLLGDEAEVITVDMYIYFDGTDDVAKNENLGYLNGKIISVEFAIDDWDYNAVN